MCNGRASNSGDQFNEETDAAVVDFDGRCFDFFFRMSVHYTASEVGSV